MRNIIVFAFVVAGFLCSRTGASCHITMWTPGGSMTRSCDVTTTPPEVEGRCTGSWQRMTVDHVPYCEESDSGLTDTCNQWMLIMATYEIRPCNPDCTLGPVVESREPIPFFVCLACGEPCEE